MTSLVTEIEFSSIQDHLYEENILSADDIQNICSQVTSKARNETLLRLLPYRAGIKQLVEALEMTNQGHLARKLNNTVVSDEEMQSAIRGDNNTDHFEYMFCIKKPFYK